MSAEQDVETLRTILHFYESDAKQYNDTAAMLQLRQAKLGREALVRLEERLSK